MSYDIKTKTNLKLKINSNLLRISTIKIILTIMIIFDVLVFKMKSFYYKLEQNSEKCYLEDINKGSVII
jgi:hypothetical protein